MRFVYGLMIMMGGLSWSLSVQAGGDDDTPGSETVSMSSVPSKTEALDQDVVEDEKIKGDGESVVSDSTHLEAEPTKTASVLFHDTEAVFFTLKNQVSSLDESMEGFERFYNTPHTSPEAIQTLLESKDLKLKSRFSPEKKEQIIKQIKVISSDHEKLQASHAETVKNFASVEKLFNTLSLMDQGNANPNDQASIEKALKKLDENLTIQLEEAQKGFDLLQSLFVNMDALLTSL